MSTARLFLFLLLSVLFASATVFPQIQNAGFEDWTGVYPDGWFTSSSPPDFTNVTQTSTAHSGVSAVEGVVINLFGFLVPPIIQSGADARGFPCNERPASFTGWYQYFPVGGDLLGVNVVLYNGGSNGTAVAFAAATLSAMASSYTMFDVPFSYVSGETPDTCIIQVLITGPTPGNTWHEGSTFVLDDVAYSGTVGVDDEPPVLPTATTLQQNYPNPFNPATTISFDLARSGKVTLTVYDALGALVATPVDRVVDAGHHQVPFDASGLPSGVYFYRLSTDGFAATRRLVLLR